MNTTTTQWFNISNGDSTNHNPQLIVDSNSPIVINSAEIQWEGVSTSGNSTDYSRNTNSDSATAYRYTNYYNSYDRNDNYATATAETSELTGINDSSWNLTNHRGNGFSDDIPSTNAFDNNSKDYYKLEYTITANSGYSGYATVSGKIGLTGVGGGFDHFDLTAGPYDYYSTSGTIKSNYVPSYAALYFTDWDSVSEYADPYLTLDATISEVTFSNATMPGNASTTYPSVPNGYSFHKHIKKIDGNRTQYFSNKVGDSVDVTANSGSTDLQLTTIGKDRRSRRRTRSQTASTNYPSVPSGYSFDRHYYNIDGNSGYHYTNKVGQSESATSHNTSDTVTVTLKTRGSKQVDVTYNTKSPSVSGDVSGDSGNITLGDGVSSNWYTLNGLGSDSKAFNHSVGGNNEARFRFKFDWEYTVPTAVKEAEVNINGTNHRIALADPQDSALQYDFYRTYVDGVGVLCFDVVDTSESGTIPYYVYHPTHGKLALRKII